MVAERINPRCFVAGQNVGEGFWGDFSFLEQVRKSHLVILRQSAMPAAAKACPCQLGILQVRI